MRLKGSVGQGGQNLAGDVLYVQILLLDWLLQNGRSPIALDGVVGNETISAIRSFQQLNIAVVDGLVEQNRSTIKALEARHIAALKDSVLVSPHLAAVRLAYAARPREVRRPFSSTDFVEAYLNRLRG